MSHENRVEWVSIKSDYEMAPAVTIRREHQGTPIQIQHYRPSRASQFRILDQVQKLSGEHRISLNWGSITGKLDMMVHLNLPIKPPARINR